MYGTLHGITVSAAYGVRNDDIAAERNADEQVYYQSDDGTVCTDGRHGDGFSGTREVADDGDICGVKKLP